MAPPSRPNGLLSRSGAVFGHRRRAGGIIVPLLIIEARNEKNPSGGKIFPASLASGWWSTEYSCRFSHWLWISAEVFAVWNSARRRARRLRRLATAWILSFNFRAMALGLETPARNRAMRGGGRGGEASDGCVAERNMTGEVAGASGPKLSQGSGSSSRG